MKKRGFVLGLSLVSCGLIVFLSAGKKLPVEEVQVPELIALEPIFTSLSEEKELEQDNETAPECEEPVTIVGAPVFPKTCGGDWVITASALYWTAHQDGMDFAIRNAVRVPVVNPDPPEIDELNNLIDDDLEGPKGKWEYGFKLGLGYNTSCDGWDLDLVWTHFSPRSHTDVSAGVSDNQSLVTLWSAFAPAQGEVNFARDIEANWKVDLNFVDFELGRAYWTSKRMSLRPFIGLRFLSIKQDYDLEHKGGSWSPRIDPVQDPFTGEVSLNNDYRGVGLHSGIDSIWHFDCGWGLYGNLAANVVYGCFDISHKENIRLAVSPYTKTEILDAKSHFRASRAIIDLALGIQWSALICDCQYGILARLGWESHLFLHQNQMWRVVRIGDTANQTQGQNVFHHRRGTLDTQGITLALEFLF
ncbi:MAG: Lpg1974 family pore-forming outer membrane protein [Simkaniaceae bacterium]|nr:Lpg1974 family pore-forming outer membrane protein [Candidatus Sacchlamyda saccharinae]